MEARPIECRTRRNPAKIGAGCRDIDPIDMDHSRFDGSRHSISYERNRIDCHVSL